MTTHGQGAEEGMNAVIFSSDNDKVYASNAGQYEGKSGGRDVAERQLQYGTLTGIESVSHLDLAAEALMDGWTRERVIEVIIDRIRRDKGYLAYRKACGRKTSYDNQVQRDMRALALTATWLEEGADKA